VKEPSCGTSRKFVSHYSIFDYWKDKAITKDGDVVTDYGYDGCDKKLLDSVDSIGVISDWGEPECWGCGKWLHDYDYGYVSDHSLQQVYNHPSVKSQLEKAHIVPHAIGGTDVPSNMFLLCSECHRESPDTKYSKEFFKWVYKTRKRGPKHIFATQCAIRELTEMGIPAIFMPEKLELDVNFGSHGGLIVPETLKSAIVGATEERWNSVKNMLNCLIGEQRADSIQHTLVSHYCHEAESILSDQTDYIAHINSKGDET